MQFGGKIIKTESFEGKDAITAELDSKKMKELIEKLKLIGEIKEKEVALEAREGDIEIMMQICNDNYQYFFVNYLRSCI